MSVSAVPAFSRKASPPEAVGDVRFALVRHLEKEEVGELFDVVAVIDAIMPQRVAEAPEFVYDGRS